MQIINLWYLLNCNGDWEHSYGVHLETLDNPGWQLKIDLTDTALEGFSYTRKKDNEEDDWYHVTVKDSVFFGASSINNLEQLEVEFQCFLKHFLPQSECLYDIYLPIEDDSCPVEVWRTAKAKMMDLNHFEIVEISPWGQAGLKVKRIEDLDWLSGTLESAPIRYKVGDIVACKLLSFFDYPSLVVDYLQFT